MILINELFPNPNGYDTGYEWIELINTSSQDEDISGWKIEIAGSYFKTIYTFPTNTKILTNSFFTICENKVEGCQITIPIAMQNGGESTDGIRILNTEGIAQDVVLYEKNNINLLPNEENTIPNDISIVTMPGSGCSLSRGLGLNTNKSSFDFFETCSPSLGKENEKINYSNKVKISEIGYGWIEFTTSENTKDWYISIDDKDILLLTSNNLEIPYDVIEIFLLSPDSVVQDSFTSEYLSPNYSYCRINTETFELCKNTKGDKNDIFVPIVKEITPLLQGLEIVNGCIIYTDENGKKIAADKTSAMALNCEECTENKCYIFEVDFNIQTVKRIFSESNNTNKYIYSIEGHLDNYLHKIIQVKGFLKSGFITTKYGEIYIDTQLNSQKSYILQGILEKENNTYTLKNLKATEIVMNVSDSLEDTGDPLIYLFLSFIILGYFVKLFGIKLFTLMYGRSESIKKIS